jgi:hypothetical protein
MRIDKIIYLTQKILKSSLKLQKKKNTIFETISIINDLLIGDRKLKVYLKI